MKPTLAEDRGGADISGNVPHHHKAPPAAPLTPHDEVNLLGNNVELLVEDLIKLHKEVNDLRKVVGSIQEDISTLTKVVLPQP